MPEAADDGRHEAEGNAPLWRRALKCNVRAKEQGTASTASSSGCGERFHGKRIMCSCSRIEADSTNFQVAAHWRNIPRRHGTSAILAAGQPTPTRWPFPAGEPEPTSSIKPATFGSGREGYECGQYFFTRMAMWKDAQAGTRWHATELGGEFRARRFPSPPGCFGTNATFIFDMETLRFRMGIHAGSFDAGARNDTF